MLLVGGSPGLRPTLGAQLGHLWPISLLQKSHQDGEEEQEQGKTQEWPWVPSKLPLASPLAPKTFHPMPGCFKEFGPKQGNLISWEARARFSEPSVGLVSQFVFLKCCQSALCLKDKSKRGVNKANPPQTTLVWHSMLFSIWPHSCSYLSASTFYHPSTSLRGGPRGLGGTHVEGVI